MGCGQSSERLSDIVTNDPPLFIHFGNVHAELNRMALEKMVALKELPSDKADGWYILAFVRNYIPDRNNYEELRILDEGRWKDCHFYDLCLELDAGEFMDSSVYNSSIIDIWSKSFGLLWDVEGRRFVSDREYVNLERNKTLVKFSRDKDGKMKAVRHSIDNSR